MSGWQCKAQRTADPPQDCNHPFCGCDPHAERIIETLLECGWGPEATRWYPIESAPRSGDFLARINNGTITVARYINFRFFSCDNLGHGGGEPTHWQRLPDPPEAAA